MEMIRPLTFFHPSSSLVDFILKILGFKINPVADLGIYRARYWHDVDPFAEPPRS